MQSLEAESACGKSSTGTAEPNFSHDIVGVIAQTAPCSICLAKLTEPFFTVFRAQPALSSPIINGASSPTVSGSEQGSDPFDTRIAHG